MPATTRRLPGPPPMPGGAYDLSALGYVEEEFLLEGSAVSYRHVGERSSDGRWRVDEAETKPYVSRIVVRRPPAEVFSGTVVVEWFNVSGGLDAGPDWGLLHRHLIRRGDAWVGVSAQRAGIEGGGIVEGMHLKQGFPERYGMLSHPGDEWSFDIFTQAGQALRGPRSTEGDHPLDDLVPRQLLAVGESQSASFLVTYINAIDPRTKVYDGYFVHGRPASGAGLDGFRPSTRDIGEATDAISQQRGERIRDDARRPVLVLQSETDVALLGGGRASQPDGDMVRQWEIAGAAHADTYILVAGAYDDGTLQPERLAELLQATTDVLGTPTGSPINAGPQQHYVGQAAIEHLARWADGGAPPPVAPRLDATSDGSDFRRDEHGISTGGVRSPWVDVPTARLSGLGQTGEVFSVLFGTTTPFDGATLARLYPGGRADYLQRFEDVLDRTIESGFVLADDRTEIVALAAASYPT